MEWLLHIALWMPIILLPMSTRPGVKRSAINLVLIATGIALVGFAVHYWGSSPILVAFCVASSLCATIWFAFQLRPVKRV